MPAPLKLILNALLAGIIIAAATEIIRRWPRLVPPNERGEAAPAR